MLRHVGVLSFTHLLTRTHAMLTAFDQAGLDTSAIGCIKRVVRERGLRGLYRGMSLNFAKATPAVCVTYVTYEKAKEYLEI